MKTQFSVFDTPFKVFTPKEIKRFRLSLVDNDLEKWADWFAVSVATVKAWETEPNPHRTDERPGKHRECAGPAARLMMIAKQMSAGKSANLIRLAAEGRL